MIETTLYYIYDPMCSWCYAFKPTLEEVKKQLPKDIKLEYIPGGLAPHNNEAMPLHMREKIESIWYQIEEVVGTKFNHDFWKNCTPKRSTYLACQATLASKAQGKEEQMINAIQEAYYLKALNPSEEETILSLAKEIKLDERQFKSDLYSQKTINEFEEKMNFRRKINLNSFPSLAINYKNKLYALNIKYNDANFIVKQINQVNNNL